MDEKAGYPSREDILREYKRVLGTLKPEDSLIVALSGHGVQYKEDPSGYFCPLDAKLDKKESLVPMAGPEGLLTLLETTQAQRKLVLINACRNDPSADVLAGSKVKLANDPREEAPKGTVVLFACSKNERSFFYADDAKKAARRNRSLFMYHVTEAWKGQYAGGKDVTVDHILNEVSERVKVDALSDFKTDQKPLKKTSFEGSWLIAAAPPKVEVPPLPEPKVDLKKEKGDDFTWAYIPPAEFARGAAGEDGGAAADEKPQHRVKLTRGFWMSVTEVTQKQYQRIMMRNPSEQVGDDLPVNRVSWIDAIEFCNQLSKRKQTEPYYTIMGDDATINKDGTYGFRLPTEAEWEFACRGGAKGAYSFGAAAGAEQFAWFTSNSKGKLSAVGFAKPNAFGLFDMHGNVGEWCWDRFGSYERGPLQDPTGPEKGGYRIVRGGSFQETLEESRITRRYRVSPDSKQKDVGFRIVHFDDK